MYSVYAMFRSVKDKFGYPLFPHLSSFKRTPSNEGEHIDVGNKRLRFVSDPEEENDSVTLGYLQLAYVGRTHYNELAHRVEALEKLIVINRESCIELIENKLVEIQSMMDSISSRMDTLRTDTIAKIQSDYNNLSGLVDTVKETVPGTKALIENVSSRLDTLISETITRLQRGLVEVIIEIKELPTFVENLKTQDERLKQMGKEFGEVKTKFENLSASMDPLKKDTIVQLKRENTKITELIQNVKNIADGAHNTCTRIQEEISHCMQLDGDENTWNARGKKIANARSGTTFGEVSTFDETLTYDSGIKNFKAGERTFNLVETSANRPVVVALHNHQTTLVEYETEQKIKPNGFLMWEGGKLSDNDGKEVVWDEVGKRFTYRNG